MAKDKKVFGLCYEGSYSLFNEICPEINWEDEYTSYYLTKLREDLHNLYHSIFPIRWQYLHKYATSRHILPLTRLFNQSDLQRFDPKALLCSSVEGKLFGLPEDFRPITLMVQERYLQSHEDKITQWDHLLDLLDRIKKDQPDFKLVYKSTRRNLMEVIFPFMTANGVDLSQELHVLMERSQELKESYEFIRQLPVDWENVLIEIKNIQPQTQTSPPLSIGFFRAHRNPDNPLNYQPIPLGPSAIKRISFFTGSSWCLNAHMEHDDQLIKESLLKITSTPFVKELELDEGTYFNCVKELWQDPDILKTKPFYQNASKLLACDQAIFLNEFDEHLVRIFDLTLKCLIQQAPADQWLNMLNQNRIKNINLHSNNLEKSELYIQENLSSISSVEEVAQHINLSVKHFGEIFKAHHGMTCWKYISQLRLDESVKMIKKGKDPLKVIAYKVGFKQVNTFNIAFKKRFGVSPLAYRKKVQH